MICKKCYKESNDENIICNDCWQILIYYYSTN